MKYASYIGYTLSLIFVLRFGEKLTFAHNCIIVSGLVMKYYLSLHAKKSIQVAE